jgi:hypothetical protein
MLHFIIVVVLHELGFVDLFWPRLIVSSNTFHVIFVRLVYNSALSFASRCCSFLLHVLACLICIFLVSRRLVLLSTQATIQFVVKNSVLKNFIWSDVNRFLSFFSLGVQNSLSYARVGRGSTLRTLILENFSTNFGLKVLFRFPSI